MKIQSPPVLTPHKSAAKPKQLPPFHVVLLNDDDHSVDYVVEMLQIIFNHPVEKGLQLAEEVHTTGKAIVMTTHRELAELKRDQILSFGGDPRIVRCKTSMAAVIAPAAC